MEKKDRYSDVRPGSTNPKANFWLRFLFGALAVAVVWFFFIREDVPTLSAQQQAQLLDLARRQLTATASGQDAIDVPASDVSGPLVADGAAFVTLTENGALRGCMIDDFHPHEPLYKNVLRNVQLAAAGDERFSRVTEAELPTIQISISIVYDIKSVQFKSPEDLLDKLEPFVDGVILDVDGQIATYMPSVWETFPDPETFLSQLCVEKGGWTEDRWKTEPYPLVQTYRVLEFAEP
jgi:AmmeMemoRadiSam system protein A